MTTTTTTTPRTTTTFVKQTTTTSNKLIKWITFGASEDSQRTLTVTFVDTPLRQQFTYVFNHDYYYYYYFYYYILVPPKIVSGPLQAR